LLHSYSADFGSVLRNSASFVVGKVAPKCFILFCFALLIFIPPLLHAHLWCTLLWSQG